jgi:murein DD-endopeptidase MepM/ murein hydrolase activator NlpD
MAQIVSPLTATLKSIKTQFISKEKLLKSTLVVQQKRINFKKSNAEREKFINYERVLERPLAFLGKPIKSVTKRLGFLDALKNFIVNVLLGFLALRLLKYLPQLKDVFVGILKAGNFIIDVAGNILNGLITFIDYGYKGYDHARKIVGKIGGDKAIQGLDKMTGESTNLINQMLIAGMLFSDFNIFGGMGAGKSVFNKTVDTIKDTVKNEVATATAQKTAGAAAVKAMGPLAAGGVVVGAGLLLSAAGEGIFQLTRWAKGIKTFSGPASSLFSIPLGIVEGAGTIFDILGAPFRYGIELIRSGFMKLFDDKSGLEKQATNLGKFDARVRENLRRFSGLFAPLFKFFGKNDIAKKLQTPGSFGSLYGEKAVKDMGYYGGGKVIKFKKYASGGAVSIERTEVKEVNIERTEKSKIDTLKIGSSIGGELNFAKVFPGSMDDPGRMDRYSYMVEAHNTIGRTDNLGFVMALTTKTLLGSPVTKDDYDNAAKSLSSFMMMGLQSQNPSAYNSLSSILDYKQFNSAISTFLMKSLKDPLSGILNLLRVQVGLAPRPGSAAESEADPCAAACDTGGGGAAVSGDSVDKAILDLISSVEAQSYDTMNVSRGATAGKPTQMTVDWLVANANGAIGRYQQMPRFLKERVIAAGGKGSDKFAPELQDRVALKMLYSGHGYARWKSGQMSNEEFGDRLSATWRGLPHNSGGTYPDRHAGRNKAHISRPAFMTRLSQIKAGGSGTMTAKIAPGSAAASVDPCICDPDIPSGDPGTLPPPVNQPAGGRIVTSSMGMRGLALSPGMHMGVDISGNTGEYLKSFTSGKVEATGYDGGYGNYVNWIDSFGVAHFYAHMHKPANVKPGQTVNAGTILGVLGSTGRSSGPHLHWEAATNPRDTGRDKSAVLSRFNPLSRYSKESPFTGSRESGGPTLTGGIRLLHKGEYVIDKDSVDLFGGNKFFDMINRVENKKQRKEKSSQLMQHLSKYTGRKIDQRPEVIYEEGEVTYLPSPPIYIPTGSGSFGSSGGSSDWWTDVLER